jgi:Elongation factor Tu domain 2
VGPFDPARLPWLGPFFEQWAPEAWPPIQDLPFYSTTIRRRVSIYQQGSREVVVATRTKAKRKGKTKRMKTLVTKTTARKTGTAVRKAKAIKRKPTNKAPLRRVLSKKGRPTAKVAVEATPVSASAEPEAVRPTPSLAAQPAPPAEPGERIGVVTHYYSHLSVAIVRLEFGTLRVGDVIQIRGHTTDFSQKVESLEVNHAPVTEVGPKEEFGLKVAEHAREHDVVFKVGT